jgi:type I restriction enzyme M protein
MKDRNKTAYRIRTFTKCRCVQQATQEVPKFSRMVPIDEIADAKSDYNNLNIPRYIDSQETEDVQDILRNHFKGGIPQNDIYYSKKLWKVYP